MSEQIINNPRVFISYSWSTSGHESFIIELSERLREHGVDVVLDKWDFKEGQDKFAFMQKMVSDPKVNKVLIFSDKTYMEKADNYQGGVGTESQIISKEVYEKVDQQKFIPIACEWGIGEEEPYFPVFLRNRKYIDFSNQQKRLDNYEQLIRVIYNRPLYKKPELGKAPEYILSDNKPLRWSKHLLENLKNAVLADRSIYRGMTSAFLDTYLDKFEDFRIKVVQDKHLDEQVLESIEVFRPFRDDFIEFLDFMIRYKNEPIFYEEIIKFFENSLSYCFPKKGMTAWQEHEFDNYRFIIHELFLYLTVILIKKGLLIELGMLTDHLYYISERSQQYTGGVEDFTYFSTPCSSLGQRRQRLKLNRISLEADIIRDRATIDRISLEDLVQADGVLFFKSLVKEKLNWVWAPQVFIFAPYGSTLQLFARAAAKTEFLKLCKLFNVTTKDELLQRFEVGKSKFQINTWEFFWHAHVNLDLLYGLKNLDTR